MTYAEWESYWRGQRPPGETQGRWIQEGAVRYWSTRVVYMVIYQAEDGLWHVWDSPLAEWQLEWSAGECLHAIGQATPIKAVWATDTEMLAEMLKQLNSETVINLQAAQEVPVEPYAGLLPPARPYYEMSKHDQRRLDIENGPGGDHDDQRRYHPSDVDLIQWSRLLGKYQRGELES